MRACPTETSRRWGNIDLWLLRAALSHRLPTGRPEVHHISRECAAALTTLLLLSTHTHSHPSPRHRATVDQKNVWLGARRAEYPITNKELSERERERAFCLLFISPRAVCMPSVEIKKSGINRSERESEWKSTRINKLAWQWVGNSAKKHHAHARRGWNLALNVSSTAVFISPGVGPKRRMQHTLFMQPALHTCEINCCV
jgi:hypothetical protein